ncbi:MAG: cation:proton antiporter [Candidatus Diapherotrites archaeon]
MIETGVLPITLIGIVIIIALGLSIISKRMGQNPVLGFILAGFLLGPFALGLLKPTDELVRVFADLGLFVLLFYLGLELSLKDFLKAGTSGVGLAIINMLGLTFVGFVIMQLLGFSFMLSILVGFMLFCTSTAVVAKFVIDKNIIEKPSSKLALSILIMQDFFGILLLVFVTSFAPLSEISPLGLTLNAIVFAVASFVAVYEMASVVEKWLVSHKFGHVEMTLFALGVGLIVATIAEMIGLSLALGAYFTGFALAETHTGRKIKADINFMRDFFLVFFFVGFGTTLFYNADLAVQIFPPLTDVLFYIFIGLALAIGAIIINILVFGIFGSYFGLTDEDSSTTGILLMPLGEFVVIIAAAAMAVLTGAEKTMIAPIAFMVILVTVVLFQPVYNLRELHRKIVAMVPKPFKHNEVTQLRHVDSKAMKDLKTVVFNLFIILCLAWITFILYMDLPVFGVQIEGLRLTVAIVAFLLFAAFPVFKSFNAMKNVFAHAGDLK